MAWACALRMLARMDDRRREDEWCRAHVHELRTLAGQWIVVEGQELVAHHHDPDKALCEARARGVRVPYLLFLHPRHGLDVPE